MTFLQMVIDGKFLAYYCRPMMLKMYYLVSIMSYSYEINVGRRQENVSLEPATLL